MAEAFPSWCLQVVSRTAYGRTSRKRPPKQRQKRRTGEIKGRKRRKLRWKLSADQCFLIVCSPFFPPRVSLSRVIHLSHSRPFSLPIATLHLLMLSRPPAFLSSLPRSCLSIPPTLCATNCYKSTLHNLAQSITSHHLPTRLCLASFVLVCAALFYPKPLCRFVWCLPTVVLSASL